MTEQYSVVAATLVAAGIVVVVTAGEQNQGDRFAGVELTATPVAGNVHMVQGRGGGNVGVFAGPDGVLLVDSLFAPLSDRLVAAVQTISDGEIRFLINTHVHPDHIGGNENLTGQGVLIFAHDNVRVRALERFRHPRGGGQRFLPAPPVGGRPVVTYNDTVSFHFNGEEVRAFLAPPAHTDGDTFVYFPESDVLHLGDVFRTTSYPLIDVYNGGTLAGTIEALELAIAMAGPDTRVIPGHGLRAVGRRAVVEFLDMTLDIRDQVLSLIAEGRTLEQVMAAQPTAAYDAQWGQEASWNANDFVPIVFYELGGRSLFVP